MNNWFSSTLSSAVKWAQSRSLWYYSINTGCCSDEVLSAVGCRYDLERFGCLEQRDPSQSDLLIVNGAVTIKSAEYIKKIYEAMLAPKYVVAIGSCAICGGPFNPGRKEPVIKGLSQIIPVDVYVPGCPPRPEAIMDGLIKLQEKITGKSK